MNPVTIKCNNLRHSFSGKTLFNDLSFTLSSGGSIAVTGRNGSGKSTLLKLVSNLLQPVSGIVLLEVNGKSVPRDDFHRYAGMSAPYISLYDELSGKENLEFFAGLKNVSLSNVEPLLKRAGIYNSRNKTVKNYSSGMKQRLKLCFALLNEPVVLILDEPMTNLDSEGNEFVRAICEEQKQKGILIIATNNPDETALCSEILNVEDFK
ncbi:MAG TPA: ABC transporter ATP-binding protein [Ignavibacteria bacterium]|nr:ABC transporter ATP-binding protein [Ignavibacteria bacterium]